MLFSSDEFPVFLTVSYPLYWLFFSRTRGLQNGFLVAISYVFYGWWDARFLLLLLFSSASDFIIGLRMSRAQGRVRKRWLNASIAVNLSILGFFKYWNFFVDSLGLSAQEWTLRVLLPVGISFYTFQTLSYTLDIYYGRVQPTRDFIQFLTFVCFFPQLVAGPIERARELLPQFSRRREFDPRDFSEGVRLILWGYFKKLVVADNCAVIVDALFSTERAQGPVLWLGLVLFSFQIYGDFSGYSDIAIGVGYLFGIRLNWNFKTPYFSRNLVEFWRRWHISLSTWFRDYVYLPLGGSRRQWARNVLVTFLLSGVWHGANWTFVVWGGLHGLIYFTQKRPSQGPPSLWQMPRVIFTFAFVTVLWTFFRAPSLPSAMSYLGRCLSWGGSEALPGTDNLNCALIGIVLMLLTEWSTRFREHPVLGWSEWSTPKRHLVYASLLVLIYLLGNFAADYDFIYFQF